MKALSARVVQWLWADIWDILTTLTGLAIAVLGVLVSVTANRWAWLFHSVAGYVLLLLIALNAVAHLGRLRRGRHAAMR